MSKEKQALKDLVDTMPLALLEANSLKYAKTIEGGLNRLAVLEKGFKISAYHTRHNDTGYELCIEDEYGNYVYKQITEEEFNLWSKN